MSTHLSPEATSRPRRGPRLSVGGLLLLVAAIGLALGLGRFWLANLDPERAWVTNQLRAADDPDATARRTAIEGLGAASPGQIRRALPVLIAAATGDDDPEVRLAAVKALGVAPWRLDGVSMYGSDPSRRPSMADAVSGVLIDALGDADARVRAAAAVALPGLAGAEAVGPLCERIARDPDGTVRNNALWALATVAPPDADAPDAIFNALENADPSIRAAALAALDRAWADPDRIADELLQRIARAPRREGVELVVALSRHDVEAASRYVPILIEAIEAPPRDLTWWMREPIIEALARIGPGARPALPILLEGAEEELGGGAASWRRLDCAKAVVAIDPASAEAFEVLGLLVDRLESGDGDVAWVIPDMLNDAGLNARVYWPRLRAIADDPGQDERVRRQVREALAPLGLLAASAGGATPPTPAD